MRATFFGDLAEKLTGLKVDEIVRQEKAGVLAAKFGSHAPVI